MNMKLLEFVTPLIIIHYIRVGDGNDVARGNVTDNADDFIVS